MAVSSVARAEPNEAPAIRLLVFQIGGQLCALRVETVSEIVPMAELARLPGQPSVLEGFLNLRGAAIPVMRLDRLFGLPPVAPGIQARLIILRDHTALLADAVLEMAAVSAPNLLTIPANHSFNNCTEAQFSIRDLPVHLLSHGRLLLEKERQCLAEFQARAQQYLDELERPTP